MAGFLDFSAAARLTREQRNLRLAVLLGAGFLFVSWIGLKVVTYPTHAPASWMGSSFLICILAMVRGRARAATLAACLAALPVIALLAHWPLLNTAIFTVSTAAESVLATWLLLRLSRTPRLANVKQAAKLFGLVILPTALVSSLVAGVACQLIYGRGFVMLSEQWFAGHLVGMILSLPTLLVLMTPDRTTKPQRSRFETVVLYGVIALFASSPYNALSSVCFLLILPAATVFAFRLGLKTTVTTIVGLMIFSDIYYYTHPNPAIWGPTLPAWVIILIGQSYNFAVYLSGLLTGLAVTYQARLKDQLERRTAMARAARGRAMAASQAKTEFLATMSHEIRTPLNGVLGFTQLLLRRDRLAAEDRRDVEVIAASGAALLSVVNDILDFSKVEAGQVSLDERPVRLAGVWEDVCAIVRPEARGKGLEVVLEAPGDDGLHLVDEQRLRQVLLNLLNNAVKFTSAGTVTLAVAWRGTRLRAEVRDTGPGIEPAAIPRLFHRFSQADSSISRRHGGTGLGLAISKGLIELMGGDIGVDSRPGEGSTFWIELAPRRVAGASTAVPSEAAEAEAAPLSAHVLLVDDHPVNRQLGVMVLELLGCTVDVAEDGVQAVEAAGANRYDLVLMDVHMPVMDGLEATRAIRALPQPACDVPIVSMSADVMPEQIDRCTAAGMNDRVSKPIALTDIEACLARWIGRDAAGLERAA